MKCKLCLKSWCKRVSLNDKDDELSDIENSCFEVDSCASNVTEFLELRKDHPPSSSSSVALSWVWEHVGRFGVELNDESNNLSSEAGNTRGGKSSEHISSPNQTGNKPYYLHSCVATLRASNPLSSH